MCTGGVQLVGCPRFSLLQAINNVEEEAHCYVIQCKQIVCGQYVADYSTTECRTFRPEAEEVQGETGQIA